MLANRLNDLLSTLNLTNTRLAAYAGFDRTNISHLKNTKLPPSPRSKTVKKLIAGILSFAEDNNATDQLCHLIQCDEALPPDEIENAILHWLFPEQPNAEKNAGFPLKSSHIVTSRLVQAMALSELTNAHLAQKLHIDPSLVSRYRTGARMPTPNSKTAELLCDLLYDDIISQGHGAELANLMQTEASAMDVSLFYFWLYENHSLRDEQIQSAKQFLSAFNSFSAAPSNTSFAVDEDCLTEILSDTRKLYVGKNGLREAVLRLEALKPCSTGCVQTHSV